MIFIDKNSGTFFSSLSNDMYKLGRAYSGIAAQLRGACSAWCGGADHSTQSFPSTSQPAIDHSFT